jgi:hypothetical protein
VNNMSKLGYQMPGATVGCCTKYWSGSVAV